MRTAFEMVTDSTHESPFLDSSKTTQPPKLTALRAAVVMPGRGGGGKGGGLAWRAPSTSSTLSIHDRRFCARSKDTFFPCCAASSAAVDSAAGDGTSNGCGSVGGMGGGSVAGSGCKTWTHSPSGLSSKATRPPLSATSRASAEGFGSALTPDAL